MLKLNTFKVAVRGVLVAIKSEWNLRFHLIATSIVILLAGLLQITTIEWAILLICIAMVIMAELLNTTIEYICNILRDKCQLPYEGSRDIRDISAGAVLVVSVIAAVVGLLIFGQYLF